MLGAHVELLTRVLQDALALALAHVNRAIEVCVLVEG
jgi:hypothetical protein